MTFDYSNQYKMEIYDYELSSSNKNMLKATGKCGTEHRLNPYTSSSQLSTQRSRREEQKEH